jgi:hypothetical protein
MMELVINLIQGQPPVLGVLFESEEKASKSYEELLSKYYHESFKLELSPKGNIIDINLILKKSSSSITYPSLNYSREKLENFLQQIKPDEPFVFAYFYKQNEGPALAPPLRWLKPQFIRVKGYKVVS